MVPAIRDNHSHLFTSTSLFILAVTNECNNRCVYCQANGGAKTARMSEDVASQILCRIAESPCENITIEFQGGEPLLNFPVIRYVVEQAPALIPDKKIDFCLVSNLSLMTEEIASFLATHHVNVSTSLDGPKILHDINRPCAVFHSSYDAVLAGKKLLEQHGMSISAIQTTTKQSLPYAKAIPREYAALGFNQVFLRPLTRLGVAGKHWSEIGYSPQEFIDFYRSSLREIIDLNLQGIPLIESHASIILTKVLTNDHVNYMDLQSPCGATFGQLAFTASGNVYTCDEGRMLAEAGDEAFHLGNVYDSSYVDWVESPCAKAVCSASLLEVLPHCCDCVYQPYCGICPVVNYALNHSISSVSHERCLIYKGIMDTLFSYLKNGSPQEVAILKGWCS